MLLVRHSLPALDPSVPPEEWQLSDEGRRRCGALAERLAAREPAVLLSSTEPKARETARRTVGWLRPEDLDGGIRALFERPDEVVFGEESAVSALARFEAAVEALPESSVVVTHGTVLSLFVAARTGRDPYELWRRLELPDVVEL